MADRSREIDPAFEPASSIELADFRPNCSYFVLQTGVTAPARILIKFFYTYQRVVRLLAAERRLAIALVIANFLMAGLQFAEPILFGQVIELLSSHASTPNGELWQRVLELLGLWAGIGAALVVTGAAITVNTDRLAHRQRLGAMSMYFEHVLNLPMAFHARTHSSRLLKVMLQGTDQLFGTWLSFYREHLGTLISVFVLVPLTILMNWRLALLLIALFAVFTVLTVLTFWHTERAQKQVEGFHSDLAEQAGDALANLSVIQTFSRVKHELKALQDLMQRVIQAQFPVLRLWALFSVLTGAASTITVISIFLFGTWLYLNGQATIGDLVTFIGIATQLVGRLQQLASFFNRMVFQVPVLSEFFDVIDSPLGAKQTGSAVDVRRVRGHVQFENVTFSYDNERQAIKHLSIDVPAGSTVALVGATGAGKSTALGLLCRLWDPQQGRILIDGMDIRGMSLASLRANIAVVQQELTLFKRSIADNLRIGRADSSDTDLVRAATLARAHEFIMAQPNGYATMLGENGRTLSGGERQRLCIARAILKDAPILILDEATSALDSATEVQVQGALRALTRDRTTFVIAHRLSTVRNADLVLVFDNGQVVEQGSYDDLANRGGAFSNLLRNQARNPVEAEAL